MPVAPLRAVQNGGRYHGVALLVLLRATMALGSTLSGSRTADEAFDACMAAERAPVDERAALLERGLTLAEAAVEADGEDAKAHLAVACNLGHLLELRPVNLGTIAAVRRVRRAIDRVLLLVPGSVDGLTAKGALLGELPGFLGGDLAEAERLLRRAIAVDRGFARAHLALARVLAARHARDEARTAARAALATAAERPGSLDERTAEALLASLDGQ